MSYCPKCGNKVDETMTFCPRCGASLKVETTYQQPTAPTAPVQTGYERREKGEKREKNEPEKREKHEKGEFGFIGWVIAGLVIIFLGSISFFNVAFWHINGAEASALWLLVVGIIIIVVGVYFASRARMRYPRPQP